MERFELSKAFDLVWGKVQNLNKAIDEAKPWELAKKGEHAKVKEVLQSLVSQMLDMAYELAIFLPDTALRIQEVLAATKWCGRQRHHCFRRMLPYNFLKAEPL